MSWTVFMRCNENIVKKSDLNGIAGNFLSALCFKLQYLKSLLLGFICLCFADGLEIFPWTLTSQIYLMDKSPCIKARVTKPQLYSKFEQRQNETGQ